MHIEFLVEEPSAEAALQHIIPKVLGDEFSFDVHPHQGKPDLLSKLPGLLRGYSAWLPEDWRIVVLVDGDDDECHELKSTLDAVAHGAGLFAKSTVRSGRRIQVLNRLAIEELEAWFFGDLDALHAAYPRLSKKLANRQRYRDPDAISGGTWETLERELRRAGYYPGGLPKIAAAREISARMVPEHNRSNSFQVFRRGLLELVS
jgi:hypothetical protein